MANRSQTRTLSRDLPAESLAGFSDWWELTKPRLSLMSVATAVLGYFAAGPQVDLFLFASLLAGTTLAAFGCGVLNQWWEREADARMSRTADRPVASGRITPGQALFYGLGLSATGITVLFMNVNAASALLTLATILLYILAYTPLKRMTPWATEVGAIPGALPPLVGWVAAGAGFSSMGWILFAILFAWQLPHFMAISWMYRTDYADGGFRMLSVMDASGRRVAVRALVWACALFVLTLLPLADPHFGWPLLVVALLLGYSQVAPAVRWVRSPAKAAHARRLFMATLIFLPVYLGTLVVDRFFI